MTNLARMLKLYCRVKDIDVRKLGKELGKVSPSNFANNRKLASTAGRKGGLKSRRGIIIHDN